MKTPSIKTVALSVLLLLGTLGILSGCKGTLAPGGAYTSSVTNVVGTNVLVSTTTDMPLYVADGAFVTAFDAIRLVFKTEEQNEAFFWQLSPSIKHSLDQIRPGVVVAVKSYVAAHAAYKANPSPEGFKTVESSLAKLQQYLLAANAAMAQATTNK
jgi:hypothetical protein